MIKTLGIDGVYVIHATKGYELHEDRINKLFHEKKLEFEFVIDGYTGLNKDIQDKYFSTDIDTKISKGVISCTLNHILAYEKIVKNKNRYALVFENDPFFLGNFHKKLERISGEIDKLEKGFIISLENTNLKFPSYWATKKGKFLYQAKTERGAGAYIIDLEGAKKILDDVQKNKCNTVIDWWHNSLVQKGVIKIFWAHPPLVEQGSHNGFLSSTISSKPKSLSRRFKWNTQKFYKTYIRRLFNEKCVL
jgi:glycosyl transferase, family 25